MNDTRYQKLGVKQTIQKSWMDFTLQMMLSGCSEKTIRNELDQYLSTQLQSGGTGVRGEKTYGMAISILSSWFAPEKELIAFRNNAFEIAQDTNTQNWLPIHWAIVIASYPFWFNVAKQSGRLLNLQDQITQSQIFNRLKEQYGDRETVSRNARYTVRSFVAWGVLRDSETKGCYQKATPFSVTDQRSAALLIESALLAIPENRASFNQLLNNPALFPFSLPLASADTFARHSNRLEITRFGLDEEFIRLIGHK